MAAVQTVTLVLPVLPVTTQQLASEIEYNYCVEDTDFAGHKLEHTSFAPTTMFKPFIDQQITADHKFLCQEAK